MNDDKRSNLREKCYSKIFFKDEEIPGYIRDISDKGFKIEIPVFVKWEMPCKKKVSIIPIEELKLSSFDAFIEIRWIQKEDFFTALGAKIIEITGATAQDNYNILLKYYADPGQNNILPA